MTKKIFEALKQAYKSLGLGDVILQAQAEALNATGLVTDENLESIVSSQKGWLESLQKNNDKRVADAINKAKADTKAAIDTAVADALAKAEAERKAQEEARAKEEAEKAAAEAAAKAAAEAKAKEEQERIEALQRANVSEEVQKQFAEIRKNYEEALASRKAEQETYQQSIAEYQKQMEERIAKMLEENKSLSSSIKAMQDEKAAIEAQKMAEARQNMILSKAKELGVPQTRIDEGFAIADTLDEAGITEYLTKVANNSKVVKLPTGGTAAPLANGEPDKAEIASLAASLIM